MGVCDSAAGISSVMVYDLDIVRSEMASMKGECGVMWTYDRSRIGSENCVVHGAHPLSLEGSTRENADSDSVCEWKSAHN